MKRRTIFPLWAYFAVAFAIAGTGFVIGQFVPGAGVPFVLVTTTIWTAFSVSKQRKLNTSNG